MDDATRRWLKENLPSGVGVKRADAKAIEAWINASTRATS